MKHVRPSLFPLLGVTAVAVVALSLPSAWADDRPATQLAQQAPNQGTHQGPHQGMGPGAGGQHHGAAAGGHHHAAGSGREGRRARWRERRMQRRMTILDTNGDGKLAVGEITGEQKRLFSAADVNGDGKLDAKEFERRGRWFMRLGSTSFFDLLDANGDGKLDAVEVTKPTERWFSRYDANGNKTLEGDELENSGPGRWHRGGRRR
jgi:hypothetical protein